RGCRSAPRRWVVCHGLVPGGRGIENGKPDVRENCRWTRPPGIGNHFKPRIVRTAVLHGSQHPRCRRLGNLEGYAQQSCYSTHGLLPQPLISFENGPAKTSQLPDSRGDSQFCELLLLSAGPVPPYLYKSQLRMLAPQGGEDIEEDIDALAANTAADMQEVRGIAVETRRRPAGIFRAI